MTLNDVNKFKKKIISEKYFLVKKRVNLTYAGPVCPPCLNWLKRKFLFSGYFNHYSLENSAVFL